MKLKLLFTILIIIPFCHSQSVLVSDINPSGDSSPLRLTVFNGELFFTANDGTNGRELWKYDGTNTILFDINTSPNTGSSPTGLYTYQGFLYFAADDGINGNELWRTDGTNSNLFLDINSGNGDATPNAFTEFNNQLIYTAFQPLPIAREPMTSDGTVAGTELLADVSPVNNFSSNAEFYTEYNGNLYFSAASTVSGANGVQFYVTDGTTAGTQLVKTLNSSGDAFPRDYIVYNNLLYFTADDGINGRELWVSDGTSSGTQMVMDLNSGVADSNPNDFAIYNNRLYFEATEASLGTELFYVNTSGSIINAANIQTGAASSFPSGLTVYNGKLYFSANDGTNGVELWETSGTPVSTVLLKDIEPGSASSSPKDFTEYNGKLYFNASESILGEGEELWQTDGTLSGTILADDINPGFASQSSPEHLIVHNNSLFFVANNGTSGRELFRYTDPLLSTDAFNFKESLKLYPNPSKDSFQIITNAEIKLVEIIDIQGKLVKTFIKPEEKYSISGLKSGIYIIKITDSINSTSNQKLIID